MELEDRVGIRVLVRAREDFQSMRKKMDNRCGIKADGSIQNVEDRIFRLDDVENFRLIAAEARRQEKSIEKMLSKRLKGVPIYTEWLSKVKGVGPIAAGWIVGTIDIHKATTVSKIWQYCGLNPGLVRGKKEVAATDYKKSMGEILGENERKSGTKYVVSTNEMIRGDRLTPGFVSPFNKSLKTALVGVLADGFIKSRSNYAIEFYYTRKARTEQSAVKIKNDSGSDRKDDGKPWSEVSKGHRDRDAKRYMIKMFLKDLYVVWRQLEGLPVRAPYAEEYLGKVHEKATKQK